MQPKKIGQRSKVNTRVSALPSYPSEILKWTQFLSHYDCAEEGDKYASRIRDIRKRRASELAVSIDDLNDVAPFFLRLFYFDLILTKSCIIHSTYMQYVALRVEAQQAEEWEQFVRNIERNCLRYLKLLYEAIDQLLDALPLPNATDSSTPPTLLLFSLFVLRQTRG